MGRWELADNLNGWGDHSEKRKKRVLGFSRSALRKSEYEGNIGSI